nr:unnamed protein product [Digitaria exilis]
MAGATSPAAAARFRVVVIGDPDTGKSSLTTEQLPDGVPITFIDTPSSPEQTPKLIAECQAADAVVLMYACDRPATLDGLISFWLPVLRQLEAPAFVIAGSSTRVCKA